MAVLRALGGGQSSRVELRPLELSILALLRMGMSNSAICHELEIGGQELGTLTLGILKKLNAGSREQLMKLSKALVEGRSEIG